MPLPMNALAGGCLNAILAGVRDLDVPILRLDA